MKRITLKIFSLMSFLIVGCSVVSAVGRPMTSAEQATFVNDLKDWVNRYAEQNYAHLKLSRKALEDKVTKDIAGWDARTDLFDRVKKLGSGKPWIDRKDESLATFSDALSEYHDYISQGFALNCRGLSSYVFQELRNRGFKCRYAKVNFNPFCKNPHFIVRHLKLNHLPPIKKNIAAVGQTFHQQRFTDLHDVVVYDTERGTYVCDFTSAAISSLKHRFGSEETKKNMVSVNCGMKDTSYLMKIPLEDYKKLMVDYALTLLRVSPDETYFGLLDNPFQEVDVDRDPTLLNQRAWVVYDHYREISKEEYNGLVRSGKFSK